MSELLEHGREGEPRWLVADARNAAQAAAVARRAAAEARRSGFVAIAADVYLRFGDLLAAELAGRSLVLVCGFGTALPVARRALMEAAARAPRPHVLLTFRSSARPTASFAREARTVYGAGAPRRGEGAPRRGEGATAAAGEALRYVQHAARAVAFARAGRHAAAERLLRESAGALERRRLFAAAGDALIDLGRLLLERGRPADAQHAFEQAVRNAEAAQDEIATAAARTWQAAARCDAGRLTDAEAVCRAVLLAGSLPAAEATWARAVLARVLLWQERPDAAQAQDLALDEDARQALGAAAASFVDGVAVKVAIGAGRLFDAGQRARSSVDTAQRSGDALAVAIASTALLRVLVHAGDLACAAAAFDAVGAAAHRAHAPLRLARARLVWSDALRRARRIREADHQLDALARFAPAAPPLLRREIERRLPWRGGSVPAAPARPALIAPPAAASDLVRLAQEEEDDAAAVRRVLEVFARDLRACRLDLLSCDAGPVSTLRAIGSGLPTHLGARVLEAGIAIGPEVQQGGHELAVPVRLGARLLAAVALRWPLDRPPAAHAIDAAQLAAAIVAPRVEQQLAAARAVAAAATAVPELVGVSGAIDDVRRAIVRAAGAPFAVLIEGESGVGKELAARALHQLGSRRERRFCDVNCAAIPEDLLDAELFGHARGAFTGAVSERAGLFEEADGGTLFLDEVADLSPRGQAKLLRVLQQHEVRRVGETFSRKIDVRLVTAANRDLREEAAANRFRQDLLYRLDVIRIHVPPLRDRPADIPPLAAHFWRVAAARVGTSATLTHAVIAALARYHWPGNVRELQNVVAALAVAAPARGRVRPSLLPAAIAGATSVTALRLADARSQFERRCIEVALARAGGNRTRAAAQLGLSRQGLLKTMVRLGIGTPPASP